MSDSAPNAELLRSLGRLARGLSILFWGLPIALVVCFQTVKNDFLRPLGIFPPVAALGWLFYGLRQLAFFQKQERVWRAALDRTQVLAIINFGLSPFLFWWNRLPGELFFNCIVILLAGTSLLFLSQLNLVLLRLTAMLPDETLRQEAKEFTLLNRLLILSTLLLVLGYFTLNRIDSLPVFLADVLAMLEKYFLWLVVFLMLLPLAMTMALIWKTKEVIFESVFNAKN